MKTFFIYLYAFFLVLGSLPKLGQAKKLPDDPYSEKAKQIFKTPARVSKKVIKKTKSTVTVTGLERIPDEPVLFVANHQGLFDILLLLGYLEKPVGFIAKEEIKKIPIINKWMTELKCVFIDRSNRRSAIKVIDNGMASLKAGQSMVVFPEGTRGQGRSLEPFKSGSLRLATRVGVPIVPLAIDGTYHMYEENNNRVQPSEVTLTVGDPIYPEQYRNLKHNQIADQLQQTITHLLDSKDK
ncbi:1-acyl-sn-glycerol-3-phosphate acyltransferase [Amphibacillus sp. MSJ-3]|uniref:lysophospholipid acyltransferase family protein n=1 Tax=Amphibacillus sp. MSJ-3 TaxID=2841505 RepID=UPI001C0EA9C1|nr:lysophospholipid acyltransferase family protein [Amphibacillus sp. MSJ-3]MBU5595021.1 1-acyl-sn-glycerol-3-phosphate acyltransferase [Amphibacillus sp. MSJ-3]